MIKRAAYGLLFVLLNLLIVRHLWQLFQCGDFVAAAYGREEIASDALDGIIRANEADQIFSEAALWKSEGKVPVCAESVGREQIVSLYQIRGQQSAIFGRGLYSGRYFTEGERGVCLLDLETVRTLFGSEHVLGMKITWENEEYEIAGILKGGQPLCVVPAKEETAYDGVAAKKAERTKSSEASFSALEVSVGGVSQQRIDGHLYYMTACLLYFFVITVFLAAAGVRAGKRRVVAGLFLVLAAEVFIMGIGFAAPGSDYLPSYWSDFDFFVQLFKDKKAQILELMHHQEFVSWQRMFGVWLRAVGMECLLGIAGWQYFAVSGKGYRLAEEDTE